ncbi:MAG: ATP-binding protein [Spirochaetota bacterium]
MMRSLFSRLLLANWLFLSILFGISLSAFLIADKYFPELKVFVLFGFGLASLFGTFHVSYRIAQSITEQLKIIENKTEAINEGDFGIELPETSIKELTNLSSSINSMSKRLKSQFLNLALEKEKFDSLMENLKEGVFALDIEGKILFQNPSIPTALLQPNSQLRNFTDACKNRTFLSFVEDRVVDREDGQIGIDIGKKHYAVRFYTLKKEGNIAMFIGVILDKTEERDIQQMREEFVQSASHELKTPITSIKGYAETLEHKLKPKSGSLEEKFFDAIMRNTDRMIRIIDDMLLISRLEDQKTIFQSESVILLNLVEDLKLIVDGIMKLKKQRFLVKVPQSLKLSADRILLEHLLLNLIKNASAYSPLETDIVLEASKKGSFIEVKVIDEGIGLSSEDTARIFERFYRVDKNRSRQEGGTGLGLAIVKHIVKIHQGSIAVSPNPTGQGSVFTIKFPLVNYS